MKKTSWLMIGVLLVSGSAWAGKKKPKGKVIIADSYEVPCIYTDNGINKEFFDDFKVIVDKSNTCSDGDGGADWGDDPTWKARMYLVQMRKLATDLPLLISMDASDYNVTNLKNATVNLDKKIDEKTKTSSLDTASKLLGVATTFYPGAKYVKTAVDGLAFMLKQVEKEEKKDVLKYDLNGDLSKQMTAIADERNELVNRVQKLRHSFDDIIAALDGNENSIKSLSKANQEILRSTVCRFAPGNDNNGISYRKFCDASHGGQDFTKIRGSMSCKDVHSISDEKLDDTKRSIKAQFANNIATSVKFHDPSGMHPEGHAARFEIKTNGKESKFAGPGGNQLLCQVLQDPRFDKMWINGSPRRLKDDARIIDAGFPVIYQNEISAWTSGGGDFWYYAVPEKDHWKRGDVKKWNVKYGKLGRKAEVRSTNGVQDYVSGLKEDVRNPTIKSIVKDECDRKY